MATGLAQYWSNHLWSRIWLPDTPAILREASPTFDNYSIVRCMIIWFGFFGKVLAPLCLVCWSLCLANVWSNRRQAHQTKGGLKFTCQNSLKMQLEHASSSFYSPQERALVRFTTASAILDQVQSLETFEAFGTFKYTLHYGVVWYWFHWIFDSIWILFQSFLKKSYQSANIGMISIPSIPAQISVNLLL